MSTSSSVYLVFQRYRSCRILLREKDWVTVPTNNASSEAANEESSSSSSQQHCGLLVYVSFSSAATHESVSRAAQTILQLPVLTRGQWGDDSTPVSLWSLVQEELAARRTRAASNNGNESSKLIVEPTTSLVLVPQANLIAKVKSQGKSIQYHGQMEKTKCQTYFENLTNQIRAELLQEQYKTSDSSSSETSTATALLPGWFVQWKTAVEQQQKQAISANEAMPSTPPNQIFRDMTDKYSSWDDDGLPLTDSAGNPLAKSALKRVRKIYEAHAKRHEKWKEKSQPSQAAAAIQNESSTGKNDEGITEETNAIPSCSTLEKLFDEALDDSICKVVAGSFGMRQGLEMKSDMGPFCHTVQV